MTWTPPEPALCLGGCGYELPGLLMGYLTDGQRNRYAKGRCRSCYERDKRKGFEDGV